MKKHDKKLYGQSKIQLKGSILLYGSEIWAIQKIKDKYIEITEIIYLIKQQQQKSLISFYDLY